MVHMPQLFLGPIIMETEKGLLSIKSSSFNKKKTKNMSLLIKDNKQEDQSIHKKTTEKIIILIIGWIFLFFESILILISFFRKGLRKKEILSTKSNLGFDIIIKS